MGSLMSQFYIASGAELDPKKQLKGKTLARKQAINAKIAL
jgi:hypothetical protein